MTYRDVQLVGIGALSAQSRAHEAIIRDLDAFVEAHLNDFDNTFERPRLLYMSQIERIGHVHAEVARLDKAASCLHQELSRSINFVAPISRLPRAALRQTLLIVYECLRPFDGVLSLRETRQMLWLTQVNKFWRKAAIILAPYRSLFDAIRRGEDSRLQYLPRRSTLPMQLPLTHFIATECQVGHLRELGCLVYSMTLLNLDIIPLHSYARPPFARLFKT